jgi:hypothetical protein
MKTCNCISVYEHIMGIKQFIDKYNMCIEGITYKLLVFISVIFIVACSPKNNFEIKGNS